MRTGKRAGAGRDGDGWKGVRWLGARRAWRTWGLLVLALGCTLPAGAGITNPTPQRAYVATYGLDSNNCGLAAPCRTWNQALTQVLPGGEMVALDSGGFGLLTITQAVTVIGPRGVFSGITNFAPNAAVTVSAPGAKVVLRGLTISSQGGLSGITIGAADEVDIEDCSISNEPIGVLAGFAGTLRVRNSHVVGSSSAGILLRGATAGSLKAVIEGSQFSADGIAIQVTDQVNVEVHQDQFTGNGIAISANGVQAPLVAGTPDLLLDANNNVFTGNGNAISVNGTQTVAPSLKQGGVSAAIVSNQIDAAGGTGIMVEGTAAVGLARNVINGASLGVVVANTARVISNGTSNLLDGNQVDITGTVLKAGPLTAEVFAGSAAGGNGFLDATGTAARFNTPAAAALDSAGNLYVVDTGNAVIRKVTSAGVVTTLAGAPGIPGHVDAAGSAARFSLGLAGIAIDASGNLYVSDDQTIRRVTPAGVVTTLAGSPSVAGASDGTGSAALFNSPEGLAVDGSGNILVADYLNCAIRKVTPAGVVSTVIGNLAAPNCSDVDGTVATATVAYPYGLAFDAGGNLYEVGDGNLLRRLNAAGSLVTVAGSGAAGSADGTGAAASFQSPEGVAVDRGSGIIYVADSGNNTLRAVTAAGVVTTLAGTAPASGSTDGQGSAASFWYPLGMASDNHGKLYVGDDYNGTVRLVTAAGAVSTLAGTAPTLGHADGTGTAARFQAPFGITADAAGNLYVADPVDRVVRKITPQGVVTTFAGSPGVSGTADGTGSAALFGYPHQITIDPAGNLYVSDAQNCDLRVITPSAVVSTLAGNPASCTSQDGTGTAAQFSNPSSLAMSPTGVLYVVDGRSIRTVTATGVVTTLAGAATTPGDVDGAGSVARFRYIGAVALDPQGNLWVADDGNSLIRMVTPSGVVSTVAGTSGVRGLADGARGAAQIDGTTCMVSDPQGNLWFGDGLGLLRVMTPAGVVTTVLGSSTRGIFLGNAGNAASISLNLMFGAAFVGQDLYVTDPNQSAVEKISNAALLLE